ncbi:hypothetical protein RD110_01660 [Rhodoferax koreense]|uniref:Glycosyl transferase family 1 n=1 Tax=Rhodoferax koreensis TaxID=1842727 RepID=A0A1P8JQP5_9BURK|nr:glycosyltransferase family 4 protein [Rhodoferax koreense]APW36070.1 hypothetical protein RD110_01660 [Rhodoferax koreense]
MSRTAKQPTYLFVLSWSLAYLGGVNQVVINLARQMERDGQLRSIVLVADWEAAEPVWETSHGLTVVRWRLRTWQAGMRLKERLAYWWWERRFRHDFARFCEEHQVVAVNCHYPGASAFTLQRAAARLRRAVALILSFHGADLTQLAALDDAALTPWRRLAARAKAAVVCSSDLGERFATVFGRATVPVVIHNGLDVEYFRALADGAAPAGPRRTILSVGRFEDKKGQDVLIDAFAAIAAAHPDADLVLLGASAVGSNLPALQAQCARLGIANRVLFFPDTPHHEVAGFYQRATVFALPSRQEPFGIAILEAGAFSLPVVASRVGGIPEIITEGEHGLLVAPDDAAVLAQALRTLLAAPDEARAMGRRLHERVMATFSWRTACQQYVALI